MPEALIASQLSPEEFGSYFATGVFRRNCEQAIFFELDPNFKSNYFPIDKIQELCKPHEDGSPHRSVYLSIYRVLENVPLHVFRNLYIVTSDGKTLELKQSHFSPSEKSAFLYQDLAPCKPRVASSMNPKEYTKRITSAERLVNVPCIAFCDLKLGELESNPESENIGDLPYTNILHLRNCLSEVKAKKGKNNKVFARNGNEFLYRSVDTGFFVGKGDDMLFYAMPSRDELENKRFI